MAAGKRVGLYVLRDGRVRKVMLQSVELSALEAVAAEPFRVDGRDVLHVRLRQFIPGASERLRRAIEASTHVEAIVLDLRDNPGGLIEELQEAAGLFLSPGTRIARIAGPQPALLSVADNAVPSDKPLHVIIGAGSASAAEALAGALQAHRRARVYGKHSFGKGLVHQTLPMADGSILIFPVGQLEIPTGHPILRHGIEPDVRTSNPLAVIGSDLGQSLIRRSADR